MADPHRASRRAEGAAARPALAVARGMEANGIGKMVAGMGGAMDLVTGAKRVIVAMQHIAKGRPKIVPECDLPLTALRPVSLIVTDLAVIEPRDGRLHLKERAPGVEIEQIVEATGAGLVVEGEVPEMPLAG